MSQIRRILVAIKYPLDTPPSVPKAAQLARALHAELELFHAIDIPLSTAPDVNAEHQVGGDPDSIRELFLRNLAAQAEPLKQEGLSVTAAAMWDSPAHEAVLRHAHRIGADLIVTERHPHDLNNSWGLHSADWELLRLSVKPVLIVKDDAPYQQPVILAALDPVHRHAKPADLDEGICALAQAFSTALGGSWHALHAYSGSRAQALASVSQVLQSEGAKPQAVQLRDNPGPEAIIETTHELGASLLVMGALSRSGLERLLIGNTAEQVIDRVSCDVLIVKPQGFGMHFSRRVRAPHLISKPVS